MKLMRFFCFALAQKMLKSALFGGLFRICFALFRICFAFLGMKKAEFNQSISIKLVAYDRVRKD